MTESPPRRVPEHVAIIMDGNGRWAKRRGLPRLRGHREGARVVREVTTHCREIGVRHLTLYAFSTENWSRPASEVAGVMKLLGEYLTTEQRTLIDNQVELNVIGEVERLSWPIRALIKTVTRRTRGLSGMKLTLAISYGAREELRSAMQALAAEVAAGRLAPEEIDTAAIEERLYTAGMPDPDLLIRTGGEQRLSNFLLWQAAYTELFFSELAWPDFTVEELERAIGSFAARERRFGKTSEQIVVPR
ncbi:MAG: isoprenyl transferase [Planctomycetota bacterium]|jgi:undecaprenyl diphosphate synthase